MANKPKEREHMQKTTGVYEIPIQEKYMLSIKETGSYFNIGIKKMRRLAELNEGNFALYNGSRYLICRHKFEEYLLELMKNPSKAAEVLDEDE